MTLNKLRMELDKVAPELEHQMSTPISRPRPRPLRRLPSRSYARCAMARLQPDGICPCLSSCA
jgi:hypothetical protein